MTDLKQTLMSNHNWTEKEAQNSIEEVRSALMERLEEGDMPYDICSEYWNLEPDYLIDLI